LHFHESLKNFSSTLIYLNVSCFFHRWCSRTSREKEKKTSDRWLLCTASEFGFFFSFFFLLSSRRLFECIAYHLHIVYTCISLLLPISEFGFFFSFFFLLSSRCLFERIAYHLHIVYTCISLLLPIRCVAAYSSISRKSWLKLMLINSFFCAWGPLTSSSNFERVGAVTHLLPMRKISWKHWWFPMLLLLHYH
jgi:hypothetical protein